MTGRGLEVAAIPIGFGQSFFRVSEEPIDLSPGGRGSCLLQVGERLFWLLPRVGDARQHQLELNFFDAAVAGLRLGHRRLCKPFRVVVLLQFNQCQHLGAVRDERKSGLRMLPGKRQGAFSET